MHSQQVLKVTGNIYLELTFEFQRKDRTWPYFYGVGDSILNRVIDFKKVDHQVE
jgi:hypothetical protein